MREGLFPYHLCVLAGSKGEEGKLFPHTLHFLSFPLLPWLWAARWPQAFLKTKQNCLVLGYNPVLRVVASVKPWVPNIVIFFLQYDVTAIP